MRKGSRRFPASPGAAAVPGGAAVPEGNQREASVRKSLAAFTAAEVPASLVELAHITGAWGVRGWVRLQPFSADADTLQACANWFVLPGSGPGAARGTAVEAPLRLEVLELRPHGSGLVARLHGIDDRDMAQALRGTSIAVPREEFSPLPDGEFYWVDLIGLVVHNRQGLRLGHVAQMLSNGPQSVLVVQAPGDEAAEEQAQYLIPFVGIYIDSVDLAAQSMVVDWQPDY